MRGSSGWWRGKVRQFGSHVLARIRPAELADLARWLTPTELAVFGGMHRADQRHGLDVVAALRVAGVAERDALVAGLIHDAGKGATGLWPRVAFSLAEAYGTRIARVARTLPGFAAALDRLDRHAAASAELAAAAGCSSRTVELIRWQDAPRDPEYGEILRLADERN